ncbi:MAG: RagB/SusD family nutrient uptake outer membrane protein [Candidatus Paceibacterota bacterium]
MNTLKKKLIIVIVVFGGLILFNSCDDNLLNETPKSAVSSATTLSTKAGFDAYLIGLVRNSREEFAQDDATYSITNWTGTDVGESAGEEFTTFRNWVIFMTPNNSQVSTNWNWAYEKMIVQANTIIQGAQNSEIEDIWESEAEKNRVVAEARFFRGYTYNFLANLYGGVPIVEEVQAEPKFDYVRASRDEVYEFAKNDLEFAAVWLSEVNGSDQDGRATSAMANHLLAEVYISLGQYDKAIESATKVINSPSYQLMTERFGGHVGEPGDVYSDLHKAGNHTRSSGNLESIYIWQFEHFIEGGGGSRNGNAIVRTAAPFLVKIRPPDGFANVATAELGRGVGRVRGTNHSIYGVWKDVNDVRNSEYNFRRTFFYNNPKSSFFGEEITTENFSAEDSLRSMYPYPRKVEGPPWENNPTSGRINKDVYVFRLAETYLLRAEAYLRAGDNQGAAFDINTIRSRANASTIEPGEVTLDFILDERIRELVYEEPRRRTLIRMGKLVERVRKYGFLDSGRETIQDYHNLWPIPQSVIDANFGADLKQNPGY